MSIPSPRNNDVLRIRENWPTPGLNEIIYHGFNRRKEIITAFLKGLGCRYNDNTAPMYRHVTVNHEQLQRFNEWFGQTI